MSKSPDVLKTLVEGKLSSARAFNSQEGKLFENHITVPAKDEFSHPNTVCVVAARKLGEIGDMISTYAQVTGYKKSFVNKDGDACIKFEHRLNAA